MATSARSRPRLALAAGGTGGGGGFGDDPKLRRAIALLRKSRLELIAEIRKELDANPVLTEPEATSSKL